MAYSTYNPKLGNLGSYLPNLCVKYWLSFYSFLQWVEKVPKHKFFLVTSDFNIPAAF